MADSSIQCELIVIQTKALAGNGRCRWRRLKTLSRDLPLLLLTDTVKQLIFILIVFAQQMPLCFHYAELAFQLCSITINIKLRFVQNRSKIIPCRVIQIPESKNPESKKNLEKRLELYESKFRLQLESGIHVPLSRNIESRACNPKTSIKRTPSIKQTQH